MAAVPHLYIDIYILYYITHTHTHTQTDTHAMATVPDLSDPAAAGGAKRLDGVDLVFFHAVTVVGALDDRHRLACVLHPSYHIKISKQIWIAGELARWEDGHQLACVDPIRFDAVSLEVAHAFDLYISCVCVCVCVCMNHMYIYI